MNKIETVFLQTVRKYLPTAKKVEIVNKTQSLYVFFSVENNEFDITDTKDVRLLQVYNLMGDEHFDEFLEGVEELYQLFSLPGEPKNLDVKFLFV